MVNRGNKRGGGRGGGSRGGGSRGGGSRGSGDGGGGSKSSEPMSDWSNLDLMMAAMGDGGWSNAGDLSSLASNEEAIGWRAPAGNTDPGPTTSKKKKGSGWSDAGNMGGWTAAGEGQWKSGGGGSAWMKEGQFGDDDYEDNQDGEDNRTGGHRNQGAAGQVKRNAQSDNRTNKRSKFDQDVYGPAEVTNWNDLKEFNESKQMTCNEEEEEELNPEWEMEENKKLGAMFGGEHISAKVKGGKGLYSCELCDAEMNAYNQVEQHCSGKNHAKKKSALDKTQAEDDTGGGWEFGDGDLENLDRETTGWEGGKRDGGRGQNQRGRGGQDQRGRGGQDHKGRGGQDHRGRGGHDQRGRGGQGRKQNNRDSSHNRGPNQRNHDFDRGQNQRRNPRSEEGGRGRKNSQGEQSGMQLSNMVFDYSHSSQNEGRDNMGHGSNFNRRNDDFDGSWNRRGGDNRPFGRNSANNRQFGRNTSNSRQFGRDLDDSGQLRRDPGGMLGIGAPVPMEPLAESPTGSLIVKLANCSVKTEEDTELATSVILQLIKTLREQSLNNREYTVADLLTEAETKINTMKALKVGLSFLDRKAAQDSGMPLGMEGGMLGGMQGGMLGGMEGGMMSDMPGGMLGGMESGMMNDMPGGMGGGMQGRMLGDMEGGMMDDMLGGMGGGGMQGGMLGMQDGLLGEYPGDAVGGMMSNAGRGPGAMDMDYGLNNPNGLSGGYSSSGRNNQFGSGSQSQNRNQGSKYKSAGGRNKPKNQQGGRRYTRFSD